MFENLKAGWKLGSATRKLVFADKKLLMYPLISCLVGIILFIALVVTFVFVHISTVSTVIGLLLYYVLIYFTSTYIIVAMLIAFRSNIKKKPMSIGESFAQTSQYTTLVFEWAVFDAIVTMLVRAIESRAGRGLGSWIIRLILGAAISFAFALATMFVIPVIIDDKVGPIEAIKRSASFIEKNFGKAFGGLLYSDVYTLIFTFGGLALLIVGAFLSGASPFLGIALVCLGVILIVLGIMLSYVLMNAVKLIIYDYMTGQGGLPEGWDDSLIKGAIKTKKQPQAKTAGNI